MFQTLPPKFDPSKTTIFFLALTCLLLFYLSLSCGRQGFDFPLLNPHGSYQNFLFFEIRLPRIVTASLAGAMLGLAGGLFQSVFRNPLASPDILGINAGAGLGISLGLLFLSQKLPLSISAFLGGLAAATLLLPFTKNCNQDFTNQKLLLRGIAISAFCSAIISFILANLDIQEAQKLSTILAGSLADRSWKDTAYGSFLIITLPLIIILDKQLCYFSLPEESLINLGFPLKLVTRLAIILAIISASLAVLMVGPLSFVALCAPQLARYCSNLRQPSLFLTMFMGNLLMVGADWLSAILPTKGRLTIGTMTSILGGIYLLYFLYKQAWRTRT